MSDQVVGEMESTEPVEIETGDLAINNTIDIPNVDDADVSFDSIRHKAKRIGVDDFDAPTVDKSTPKPKMEPKKVQKVEQQDDGEEPEVESAGQEAEDEGDKEIKNPQAWARVLKRQKDAKAQEVRTLETKLAQMQETLDRLAKAGVKADDAKAQPEDEQIDPETDPAGALMQAIRSVKADVEKIQQERQQAQFKDVVVQTLNTVNDRLRTEYQSDPVFQKAAEHVGRIMERQAVRKYPDATPEQRLSLVADQVNMSKLTWARDGLDPVEAMYEVAMDLGFDPEAVHASLGSEPATPKPQAKTEDPKETIAKAKRKASSVASTATVAGAKPAKSFTGKELLEARDEGDFNHKLNKLIEDGEVRAGNSWGKTPSFSQLLPGKARRIS